jgi:hypothetical protein
VIGTKPTRSIGARVRPIALFGLAAICLLTALGLLASVAFAGARIVRPAENALVVKPGRLRVTVKVGKGAGSRLRAQVDNRYVSGHFHRRGQGKWVAAVPVAKLALGSHTLTVADASGRVDTTRFYVARRDQGAVKVGWHTGWRRRSIDLLKLRSGARIWRGIGYPKVFLNGRRVDDRLHYDSAGRGFVGGFGPEAGLRYGRNRVKVEVLLQNGTFATAHRSFRVRRNRPLAGAGPDQRTSVGRPVILDGGATRLPAPLALTPAHSSASPSPSTASASSSPAATATPPVEYQWKVISAPPGTPPKLREAQSEEAIFTPEVPGTYVIQSLVEPEGGGPAAIDDSTIEVPPTVQPIGMPIQTITASGGIAIAGEEKPFQRAGVKLLVLNARTFSPKGEAGAWGPAEQTFVPQPNGEWVSTADSNRSLVGALKTMRTAGSKNQTVVISGQGVPLSGSPLNKNQTKHLAEALTMVGGTVAGSGQTPQGAADLLDGQWSVIGYPYLTEGHAFQNFGLAEEPVPSGNAEFPSFPTGPGRPGSLNGFEQMIDTEAYAFVSPEFLELNTKWTKSAGEMPSSTQNTIAVGGTHYASAAIPNGAIAMQVLVLDGSDPGKVLENSTYRVLEPNCVTASGAGGIASLDQALHHWATEAGPSGTASASNLVIVQDFGRQGGRCWPGGNDDDWLQDSLPKMSSDGTGWNGSKFPTKRSELISMWNNGNAGGDGTVAGNFGILAGTVAHDEVANYRRPFWDDELMREVNRDYGGITLVASTNLYQHTSAFFQGQGENGLIATQSFGSELDDGTVTGLLRRNEQSQWELESSAAGDGTYNGTAAEFQPFAQASLPETLYRAPTAWPCTPEHPEPCKGSAAEIKAAQRYFATQAASSEAAVLTVRDLYADEYEGAFTLNRAQGAYPSVSVQEHLGGGTFSEALYETLRYCKGCAPSVTWKGMVPELEEVEAVGKGIKEWRQFFEINIAGQGTGISTAGSEVVKSVNEVYDKLEKEDKEEEMEASIAASTLYLASELFEIGTIASGNPEAYPLVAPSMGAFASMIDVGTDASDIYSIYGPDEKEKEPGEGDVRNATESIKARVTELSAEVQARYIAIAETMQHFGGILVTDPEKLRIAANHFEAGGGWALKGETLKVMRRALILGVQRATFETTLPLAFVQWVTSPRWTRQNPGGSAEVPYAVNYNCSDTNSNGNGSRDPWPKPKKNYYEATWAMEGIEYASSGPIRGTNTNPRVNAQSYDVRGLKSKLDDMRPDRDEEAHEPGLQHSGSMASPSLMEEILTTHDPHEPLSFKPNGLGMSKEEIFGLEDWETRKFGCGKE